MSSTEEPVNVAVDTDVEIAPPATPVDLSMLSGGEDASKSSPEASKENDPVSSVKTSTGTTSVSKRPVSSSTAAKRPTSSSTATSRTATSTTRAATSSTSSLSKPPTRPTTTSATRKPLSSSTTSSHRSRPSVSSSADEKPQSIASSGDEKRGISSTAKRMSMAGTASTRAPLKTSSTLDRRSSVAGSSLEKKPATSTTASRAATSTSKPVGRLTSATGPASRTTTSTTATRPLTRPATTSTTTRPSTSSSSTDPAKKRLSTLSSATKNAGDTEKLQALQSKLMESEETVASLKAELDSVNEKLSQLSVSGEDMAKDDDVTNSVHAEHAAALEKLTSAHAEELQSLQARLKEAESQNKELEEKSQKELEEAKQSATASGDRETAVALEELKENHKAQLNAIEKEVADHKAAAASFEEQINLLKSELESQKASQQEEKALALDSLERELNGRDQVIDNLNNEFKRLTTSKDSEIIAAKEASNVLISELQEQVTSLKAKLVEAASAAQQPEEITSSLTEKETEINELKEALEKLQGELKEAQDGATSDISSQLKELETSHEAAIANLKAEHDSALSSLSASHAEELALAKTAAESTGTENSRQLQELRDSLEAAKSATQGNHESAIAELTAAHEVELKVLQAKFEESEKALVDYRTALEEGKASAQEDAIREIDALRHKVELLETQLATGSGEIKALQQEVQAKQAEAEQLHTSLKNVESQFQEKDAQHDRKLKEQDSKMKALEDKAAEATRLLDEQTAQAAAVAEKHAMELEALKVEHAAELQRVRQEASSSQGGALEELQLKHDDLLLKKKELESAHITYATRVEALETELKSALERHAEEIAAHTDSRDKQTSEFQKQFAETQAQLQAELESLRASSKVDQESHAKQVADLQQGFEETKARLQIELQAVQTSKAADADAEHGKAIEELLTLQEAKVAGVKEQLEASHNTKIDELQRTHEAALASVNEQLAQATAVAQDTSVLDSLKATIAELEQKLIASEKTHATAQETAVSALRDLQERHAAEISRIQAAHAELGQKHDAAITQVEDLQKSAAASSSSKSELDSALKQLAQYREEYETLKMKHANTSEELEEYQATAKIMEEKLAAGERDLGEQIDKNMQLLNQLGDVDAAISGSRRRVRELEAELAALKASNTKSSSSGLEASKWASAEEGEEKAEGGPATEGEDLDLGSSIEGTVGDPRFKSSYSSYLPDFHPFT
ncbi:uncharacterized protein N7477_009487 [Penicillium maclennaniae]|uniref:uncharacterized protein n=1 Tax=Penicillium maclennaniae TaxID=1343394 RepID=UPI002542046C|nr:uncharacterized protein N7477_009487 [Penicillium maclennaniae]KAJ5661871.1 hypothetical protein N7477_009487 [Penicillium maclennaniae]